MLPSIIRNSYYEAKKQYIASNNVAASHEWLELNLLDSVYCQYVLREDKEYGVTKRDMLMYLERRIANYNEKYNKHYQPMYKQVQINQPNL